MKRISGPFIALAAVMAGMIMCYQVKAQTSIQDLSGNWLAVFKLRDTVPVPVNFEIKNNGIVYFINAGERFETGKIKQRGDSVLIPLDQFDNELALKAGNNILTGVLRRQDNSGIPMQVTAERGNHKRFGEVKQKPAGNISGKYELSYKSQAGEERNGVGLFKQEGNKLKATIMKVSGDSRYLEGVVDGNKFYLSSFIGSSPSYYRGSFTKDGKITGEQVGTKTSLSFTGTRNEKAELPDAYKLTFLKDGFTSLHFSFPDINGNKISLKDDKYKNKVVILAISGTWCPNCVDEAAFLSPWYRKNKHRGVEIISLHYERKSDTDFVKKVMTRFRDRFAIEYDQVFAGIAKNDSVAASLPELKSFITFPTTIFIDKNGNVAKIHTGYSGPATGKFYDDFIKEFNEEVDSLLAKH